MGLALPAQHMNEHDETYIVWGKIEDAHKVHLQLIRQTLQKYRDFLKEYPSATVDMGQYVNDVGFLLDQKDLPST